MNGDVKLGRAAARSGECAQHFSNASCNTKCMNICACGLKTPGHAPKVFFVGEFDPLNGEQYQRNSSEAHPSMETR